MLATPKGGTHAGSLVTQKNAANSQDPNSNNASFLGKYRGLFLGFLLVAAILAAYQPVWHAGFIWDDDFHLTKNPCVIEPQGFKAIWTTSAAVYYPLVLTSFWIQHALWGLNPLPYHLVNVALHATNALLLWRVLRALSVPGAWLGAAFWGLHPVQVESVAWITELKNTQSCFFYLCSILCFLDWRDAIAASDRRRHWIYCLALACAGLAILSKASTVVLPLVLGLCWWWHDAGWNWRNVQKLLPFLAISAVAAAWTVWEQRYHSGALGPDWNQNPSQRVIIAGKAIWFYLGKLAWPHPLAFIYPHWTNEQISGLGAFLPTLLTAALLAGLYWGHNSWARPAFFALAYFVVALAPVLGFFNVYYFRYAYVADHFQYLASVGPLALAASGITLISGHFKRHSLLLTGLLSAALLGTLGALTRNQTYAYRDPQTLWETTLQSNPKAFMAHHNLGLLLLESNHLQEAADHFRAALEINPDFSDAHNSLGLLLTQEGRLAEARVHLVRALELHPGFADAYNNLGNALAKEGNQKEAIAYFQKAIALSPRFALAYYNLANSLLEQGEVEQAISQFQASLRIQPEQPEACYNLGIAFVRSERWQEATAQFEKALVLRPDFADAQNNLGNLSLRSGRLPEAIAHYTAAAKLNPDVALFHLNLASALLQSGDVNSAIFEYESAVKFNQSDPIAHARLADLLVRAGLLDPAIFEYQQAVLLKPDFSEAESNLGTALGQNGCLDEALFHLIHGLALNPDSLNAQKNLATALRLKFASPAPNPQP
jgi:tetratricopeptide (TPR) repeat protein